jgi:hypothetical protein
MMTTRAFDPHLASSATDRICDPVPGRGQQGFPSMSGDRPIRDDAGFGGDDVLTAQVPGGL